jgi:hypothetical protein
MTMLTAAEIISRHPQGCWVFDATGRRLNEVLACDPETGEVVRLDREWLCDPCESLSREPVLRDGIPAVHGFWPSPLTIEVHP